LRKKKTKKKKKKQGFSAAKHPKKRQETTATTFRGDDPVREAENTQEWKGGRNQHRDQQFSEVKEIHRKKENKQLSPPTVKTNSRAIAGTLVSRETSERVRRKREGKADVST